MLSPFYRPPSKPRHGTTLRDRNQNQEDAQKSEAEEQDTEECEKTDEESDSE